jgi:hypothetical protein
VAEQICMED